MVKYKCPMCGGEVSVECILTNPPITCYRCKCGYHKDIRHSEENTVKIAPL